jgi:competence protein ComGC
MWLAIEDLILNDLKKEIVVRFVFHILLILFIDNLFKKHKIIQLIFE